MPLSDIAPGVARLPISIANAYFVEDGRSGWVLIDSGTPGHADRILEAAAGRFGRDSKPTAILLTHGHFDHAGSARVLAHHWNVPVYAHYLESPYLTGKSAYPPTDPTGAGCVGFLSRFFPATTTNVGSRLRELPAGGQVPGLRRWMWFHTPGHAPGHVSFFNEKESILLSGDAVTTLDMGSCSAMMRGQEPKIHRPPAPYTFDWNAARTSIELLAELRPQTLGPGHGREMSGPEVTLQLRDLARNLPIPAGGRYSVEAARADVTGLVYVPPAVLDPLKLVAGIGMVVGAILATVWAARRQAEPQPKIRGAA